MEVRPFQPSLGQQGPSLIGEALFLLAPSTLVGAISAPPPTPGSAPLCPGCPLPFPGTPCTPTPYLTGPWRTQIVTWEKQQQQQKPPLKVTITTTSYSENESEMGRIKHLPRT